MIEEKYWHVYYDASTIERSQALLREFCVDTADNITLHVDAYLQPNPSAPVILLTHGEGGYSRLFVRQALALHDRHYSVLVLDQRGSGASTGTRDFSLEQLTQDVLDAAHWARRSFQGPLFLGGANQGGELAYLASTLGAPVIGLICHELLDLTQPQNVLAVSRFASLGKSPAGVALANAAARALMALSPRMRLPLDRLRSFDGLLDERDNGHFEAWQLDPSPARQVTPRYAVSALNTHARLPYEQNALPILVINPLRDRILDPQITRRNFERLGGPKTYAEIDFGHWSLLDAFAQPWSAIVDDWIKSILA